MKINGVKDDFIKYIKDMLKDYKRVVIATNPSLKGFVEDIKSKAFTRKRVSVVIENVNNWTKNCSKGWQAYRLLV